MSDPHAKQISNMREDIVVSVCFFDLSATDATLQSLRGLAKRLDRHYRFRELILVVDDSEREAFLPFIQQITDLRLFVVRPSTEYYERRVIAAEEAIGDIVAITNVEELPYLNFELLLERANQTNALVLATQSEGKSVRAGLSSPIAALGRLSGFKVNVNDLQTLAIPRTLLNQLLSHSEPQLALRFPPRDPRFPLELFPVSNQVSARNKISDLPRRLQILQKLLVFLAPVLLVLVSLASTILAMLGLGYAFYVIAVWLYIEDLAAGWLTTSAMLSLSAVFMGLSMLGLSLGLQQLLNHQNREKEGNFAEEVNRIDLFGKVASDLNVEIEIDVDPAEDSNIR